MRYCIGVDLGGTNIAIGLLDLDDRVILHKKSVKTRAPRPCEEISRDIKEICLTLCERQGIGLDEVEWIVRDFFATFLNFKYISKNSS